MKIPRTDSRKPHRTVLLACFAVIFPIIRRRHSFFCLWLEVGMSYLWQRLVQEFGNILQNLAIASCKKTVYTVLRNYLCLERLVPPSHIVPSFKLGRWVGMKGVVMDVPFKPSSCRSQITVKRECSDELFADNLVGIHWITTYGDYRKEIGYALRRVGIPRDNLDEVPTKKMS